LAKIHKHYIYPRELIQFIVLPSDLQELGTDNNYEDIKPDKNTDNLKSIQTDDSQNKININTKEIENIH
jgi:hypothetical protein